MSISSKIIFAIKETCIYAFLCGLYERTKYGDGFGRSHDTNDDWNESYDSGANLSDFFTGNKPQ